MISLAILADMEDVCLDAVDFQTAPENQYDPDANVMRFRLNGVTYVASEDPEDGYRSSMREIVIEEKPEKLNSFPGILVHTHYCETRSQLLGERRGGDGECDILQIIDTVSGKVIVEVGTDRTDDYYPYFVGAFDPKNITAGSWDAHQAQIATERALDAERTEADYADREEFGAF